jgi:hypothetical protein
MEIWALALSIVAVILGILALPTVIQMLCNKPHIKIKYGVSEFEGGRFLECEIFNVPITTGLLRLLHIKAAKAEDIVATFDLSEAGTNRVVHNGTIPKIITIAGSVGSHGASLAPSTVPAKFEIAQVNFVDQKVTLYRSHEVIPVGAYFANVQVNVDGITYKASRRFNVKGGHPYINLL